MSKLSTVKNTLIKAFEYCCLLKIVKTGIFDREINKLDEDFYVMSTGTTRR